MNLNKLVYFFVCEPQITPYDYLKSKLQPCSKNKDEHDEQDEKNLLYNIFNIKGIEEILNMFSKDKIKKIFNYDIFENKRIIKKN